MWRWGGGGLLLWSSAGLKIIIHFTILPTSCEKIWPWGCGLVDKIIPSLHSLDLNLLKIFLEKCVDTWRHKQAKCDIRWSSDGWDRLIGKMLQLHDYLENIYKGTFLKGSSKNKLIRLLLWATHFYLWPAPPPPKNVFGGAPSQYFKIKESRFFPT